MFFGVHFSHRRIKLERDNGIDFEITSIKLKNWVGEIIKGMKYFEGWTLCETGRRSFTLG